MNSAPVPPAPSVPPSVPGGAGALYRTVWRWHFYVGLLVAPFAIFLAVTGAIYLWKPQYEAWRYRDLFTVPVPSGAATVSAAAQLAAAQAAAPVGWRAQSYTPAFTPGATTQVMFKPPVSHPGPALTLYVNPYTGAVVGRLDDSKRLMTTIHDLHGTLLAGLPGELLVELAASWALVLFLTGLYLWWPRPRFVVWGFLLPRLRAEGRMFWRDLHAVPAAWLSLTTVFLLTTGLLWTKGAGQWYRTLSTAAGQATPRESSASAHHSELVGWSPPLQTGLAEKIDALASTPPADDPHAHHGDSAKATVADSSAKSAISPLPLDRVIALAEEHAVPKPYAVALPAGPQGIYSALTDRNQAFNRAYLHLDQYSGKVLADVRSKDFGLLARFGLWGIIAHEGRLFGLANQLLGTLAALGVVLLAASGLVMWWRRRAADRYAASQSAAALPRPVLLGTLALAALLPLLAASLALIWLADRLFGHRFASFRA
jgi:uncharacterized iron-regulated membrane protein